MTVWSRYGKCWECGAEAGSKCVDDDNEEAVEVCDGRRLVIDDSAARTKAPKGKPGRCQHCRTLVYGRLWCPAERCQKARQSAKNAAAYLKRRGPLPTSPCDWCGVAVPLDDRRTERIHCGATECKAQHRRAVDAARKARKRAEGAIPPQARPCEVCDRPCPVSDRRPYRYCGSRCRETARSRRKRSREAGSTAS